MKLPNYSIFPLLLFAALPSFLFSLPLLSPFCPLYTPLLCITYQAPEKVRHSVTLF